MLNPECIQKKCDCYSLQIQLLYSVLVLNYTANSNVIRHCWFMKGD